MKLFNTLTRSIENFAPIEQGMASLYSCGPTVYDHIHIGNLASFIYADTLRRALTVSGLQTKHVMNFTDVDDKTIRRSQEVHQNLDSMDALLKVTNDYSSLFLEDMEAVGNDVSAITFVKATQSIPDMQRLIRKLLEDNVAYHSEDGIYFSINAYKEKGKQYGQLTDVSVNSTSQARIPNDEYDKESAHDFALWKLQKGNEPAWGFEVDGQNIKGRPGWHIECSAMSVAALGQPFDIHTGGVDLVFPHHENEIAQSTAVGASDKLANYFVHNEHILIDGKKMSKSLNNFYTLKDITDKGFDPFAFRLLVLQAHYRHQAHFSWENLEAAQNRLNIYRAFAALRWQVITGNHTYGNSTEEISIKDLVANDLDLPKALAFFSGYSAVITDNLVFSSNEKEYLGILQLADDLLGLNLNAVQDITDGQKQLLGAREQAREAKDWPEADKLRGELEARGVGVRDTQHGSIWFPL